MDSPLASLKGLSPLPRLVVALARRHALEGAARVALPLALSASALAIALARYSPTTPRLVAFALITPALAPFVIVARRAERSPIPLALEVDRRLDAHAAVVTAAEITLGKTVAPERFAEKIIGDARKALDGRRPSDVTRALSRTARWSLAACALLLVAGVAVPVRPAPRNMRRPAAATRDTSAASAAREAAEALAAAAQQDPAHAPQLSAVAEAARALARALEVGVARDEALARSDDLERSADEALSWARDPQRQRALDAALSELTDPEVAALRDALARGDLERVDEAVRRLADQREAASRQRAMEALSRAAQAARNAGAQDLANALEEERDLLRRRGASSELARAVAQALGDTPAARRIAEHLGRNEQDQELSRALDEVMREMDRQLTAEERRRIAQAMARMANQADAGSRANFDRAARAMTPEEARAAMRALLESMRNGSLDRTRAGNAARAGGAARGDLARLRVGLQTGRTPARGGGTPGSGGRGGDHDEGHMPTTGRTDAVRGGGFTAPTIGAADPRNPGVPVSEELVDTTGAHAVTPDEARIRQAAPAAMHGIERTPVPDAYRDQVRVYFGR